MPSSSKNGSPNPSDQGDQDAFGGFAEGELGAHYSIRNGKVRQVVDLDNELLIITTDRISAFDRILGLVPFKGEMLSRLSEYWFSATSDIIPNHHLHGITGRTMLVRACQPLPVEVVVRGYLSGSAWRDYAAGRPVSGIQLPPGLRQDQLLPQPILTPSTKAEQGLHDAPISSAEIIETGLVESDLWRQVELVALELFARGTQLAAERGLVLVDTKYEFGVAPDGSLMLIDELHTPDSSRFKPREAQQSPPGDTQPSGVEQSPPGEPQPSGVEQSPPGEPQQPAQRLDKEYLREWLMQQGWSGEGEPPAIPPEVFAETAERYKKSFALLCGEEFSPTSTSHEAERMQILSFLSNRES
ncbi:MAG: phosphoribosylaminoimidazolesuccinocarboxamide synthase [Spirochaetaceae bacterium]|nr:MAG: phosphoribosylaminoimidazolesuccinocarboxamide synthase [Spirochaetaceae bacterium]